MPGDLRRNTAPPSRADRRLYSFVERTTARPNEGWKGVIANIETSPKEGWVVVTMTTSKLAFYTVEDKGYRIGQLVHVLAHDDGTAELSAL